MAIRFGISMVLVILYIIMPKIQQCGTVVNHEIVGQNERKEQVQVLGMVHGHGTTMTIVVDLRIKKLLTNDMITFAKLGLADPCCDPWLGGTKKNKTDNRLADLKSGQSAPHKAHAYPNTVNPSEPVLKNTDNILTQTQSIPLENLNEEEPGYSFTWKIWEYQPAMNLYNGIQHIYNSYVTINFLRVVYIKILELIKLRRNK